MNAQQTNSTIPATPLLRLHLFGGFAVTRDSGPAPAERWTRPSAQTLVKLLAVVPDHQLHREQAMDICWPDADQQSATGSLRVALHAARRALEPELAPRASSSYLISDGALLRLDPATVRIDADEAETAARAALASGARGDLAAALDLFTGDLLPEDRYASWAQARREQLVALREEVQLALAAAHMAQGSLTEAAAAAELVLAGSPAEEAAHRILMEAYLGQGLRRLAVRQYHLCREALDAELGVRPGPETERLHRLALTDSPSPAPTAPSLPAPLRVPAEGPLRGRDNVLRRLLTADRPPVTLLTGEAGVGKTTLAAEVARRAAATGTAVLWGGGHDAEGHTPYGAFAEALDGWLAEWDAGERARVGAEYPELAAFLPSLGRVRADGERSPEEERDRLFRAAGALLGELAAARPVLVVLDDLHAADEGSFQLLSHLARRVGAHGTALRFLVTYREEEVPEGDPRRSALAALRRARLIVREDVGRLDRDACLAVARDGGAPAQRLDRVWELSLGNPLFALELAREPVGDFTDEAPDGVRQLVGERLGRLGRDTRRVVEALAVAGGEVALSELLDVAEHGLRPPMDAVAALEDAIGAALIEERQVVVAGRAEAGLAFRHPLVRLTCYEQLTVVRRRQLHAAFAQTVLRHRPDAVDALASHFARADDPRAAEYLRRAAERAAAVYANDTADRYYRDLVARLDVDAARARLAHAQVLRRMGQFGKAADVLRLALAEFARRGDHDDTVLAAARLAETLVKAENPEASLDVLRAHPPGEGTRPEPVASHYLALGVARNVQGRYEDGYAAARQALSAALRVPGVVGQGLAARCHTGQATNLALAGRFREAREAAGLALAPAEAYGDSALLGSVLSVLRENARREGRLREAVDTGERALGLAEESGDPTAAAFERANLAELWLQLGESELAREAADAAVAGVDADDAWSLPYALVASARVLMSGGTPEGADELLGRAERAAGMDQQAHFEVRTARAELALHQRRPELVPGLLRDGEAPVLTAWAHVLRGERESARRVAAAEIERARGTGERLAEVEAGVVHAVALGGAAGALALAAVEEVARGLPYPAGVGRVVAARGVSGSG
ncbi:AAA family ATPase [Streptomyces sp. VRA16 Mangrove soil]|uniref:ATP-binding protein n=1 Tax=Streptomyces sp. VRA16 Mangrove soil TaxID=2817434 RepID=UPI001A9DF1F7|nr:AAA family ATPase [Streptomyces sp. VRA16 Mangrove soil]MBO1331928.1 AAA family ATPase [Streptomyces sp. VRA16 Mangrove soil]